METIPPFILLITADQDDCAAIRDILSHLEWDVVSFPTLGEAGAALRRASVVLCDAEFPDGGWRDVMRSLGTIADPPLLIVAAHLADNRLWAEVLNEGGHDVLAKPYRATEVLQSITWGFRWRESRGENGRDWKYRAAT